MGVQVVEEMLDVDFDTGCLYLVRWYIYGEVDDRVKIQWAVVCIYEEMDECNREEIQQACPLPFSTISEKFSLTHSIPSLYSYSLITPSKAKKNLCLEKFSVVQKLDLAVSHTEPARWPFAINRPFCQYFLNYRKDVYCNLLAELRSSYNKCIHMCKSRILMGEKGGVLGIKSS